MLSPEVNRGLNPDSSLARSLGGKTCIAANIIPAPITAKALPCVLFFKKTLLRKRNNAKPQESSVEGIFVLANRKKTNDQRNHLLYEFL